jgi:hypothetical protein
LDNGSEEDEILFEEVSELGIFVKLLTQQFAAPSGVGVKIDEDQLVIAFGFGRRLVQGSLEPCLGRSRASERKHEGQSEEFFHIRILRFPQWEVKKMTSDGRTVSRTPRLGNCTTVS